MIERSASTEHDLDLLRQLADVCNRHEGVDLPLVLAEPAVQFFHYEDGAVIGYFELVGSAEAEGCGMVHPDHRRRGIGRALLTAAGEEWRERGLSSFLLVCDEAGTSGKAFALSVGAGYLSSEFRMKLDATRLPPPAQSPLRLRAATVDDVDAFAGVMAAAFEDDEYDSAERRQQTVERFQDPRRIAYVAELEGQPVGGLEVFVPANTSSAFINAVGMLPEYQRRGHGRQMLLQTLNVLVAEETEQIMIEVSARNRRALSLYNACGFVETTVYKFYRYDV